MPIRSTCKNPKCHKTFTPERAGARWCSAGCRTAGWRLRRIEVEPPKWFGKTKALSCKPKTAKGKKPKPDMTAAELAALAASNAARRERAANELPDDQLAEHLVRLSIEADAPTDADGEQMRDKNGNLITTPKTGRRFFYVALSNGYVKPDMGYSDDAKESRDAAYDRINKLLVELRKQGEIGWDAVVDLTRELDQWQTYESPREARKAMRRSYTEDRWLGQLYYPCLIVEKDTLEPICKPMARRWQMPFASSRGYSSLKLQHDVATMFEERRVKTGQWPLIYFVSDLDPSGEDLQRAWEDALTRRLPQQPQRRLEAYRRASCARQKQL
jgi:hypothetical protein